MKTTISNLRQNIYKILDMVIENNELIEIERKGYIIRIAREKQPLSKLKNLKTRKITEEDPESFTHIDQSIDENWTRDPFDRLIVSYAKIENSVLITKDELILKHYNKAMW